MPTHSLCRRVGDAFALIAAQRRTQQRINDQLHWRALRQ
jgi:hypothetical protein